MLGGLYFLWMWPAADPARRLRLAALTALAPLLLGGGRLGRDRRPAALAARDRRSRRGRGPPPRRPSDAPYWALQYYGFALREPIVIGFPIGLYFAWRFRRREAILPLAVVAAMTLVFMIGPIFGLPLIGRYVRTSSVLLCLFYGLAVAGWVLLRDPVERRRWRWIGIGTAALSIAFLPWHVGMLAEIERRIDRDGQMYSALRATAEAPIVRRAVAECGGRISAADHRPLPHLRFWLDTDPGSVGTVANGASPLAECCCCRAATCSCGASTRRTSRAGAAAGLPPDLRQRRLAGARRAGLRQTSSSVTASWPTSRNSV